MLATLGRFLPPTPNSRMVFLYCFVLCCVVWGFKTFQLASPNFLEERLVGPQWLCVDLLRPGHLWFFGLHRSHGRHVAVCWGGVDGFGLRRVSAEGGQGNPSAISLVHDPGMFELEELGTIRWRYVLCYPQHQIWILQNPKKDQLPLGNKTRILKTIRKSSPNDLKWP